MSSVLSNFRFAMSNFRFAMVIGLLAISLLSACGDGDANNSADNSETPTSTPSQTTAPETSQTTTSAASEAAVSAPDTENLTVTDLTKEEIWQRLQQPSDALYVVLLRHALAPGTGDPANFQLDDCSTQRNLNDEGREQARQIGQAFRDRNVEVQQVLSSQWCRCLETAELMDLGEVKPYPTLNSFFRDRSTAEAQTTETKQFLLSQIENPGVIVMVTHQVNITGITDIVPRSGEAVVVQVDAEGLTQVGQFLPAS